MSKFLSGREREFKVGIVSYTENNTVLQVVGNSNFTGIVTAAYFYGDGSNLTNISAVGSAATVAITTVAPSSPTAGSLWFNPDAGRTFVYYDESIVGIGTSSAWIDASPSNGSSAGGSSSGGSSTVSIGLTAPTGPNSGDLWYSIDYGKLFVWYDETTLGIGSTSVWVDTAPSGGSSGSSSGGSSTVSIGLTAPGDPSSGDLWYSTDYGRIFVWYDEVTLGIGSTAVWVDAAPFNSPEEDVTLTPAKTENTIVATEGQTVFSVNYTAGYVDVYLNGVRLSASEFIATNGTSITLSSAATAGDVLDVVEYTMGIGATGAAGPAAQLTIATRSGVLVQNISGIAFTVSLRSGIGTVNI